MKDAVNPGLTDPITVAVIGSALRATVNEMGEALRRSSHSPIIREMLDYSCAVFTAKGDIVSQDEFLPALLGAMAFAMPVLLKENPVETIRPGDMFIGNDPYRGGTHTPDIHIFAPVFVGGKLVAWSANLAHHADVGGTNPGTEGFANRSIFEEGIRFPYVKVFEEGRAVDQVFRYIENNVRDPQSNLGDLRAQIAAAKLGVQRLDGLFAKYGVATMQAAMEERIDQDERKMRALIAQRPDGEATASGFLDNDGLGGDPVEIRVKVTVRGDNVTVDFTGTAPQMAGGMNCSRTAASSAVIFAVKAAFGVGTGQTAGCVRPITIILPEGSMVNPRFPAAVSLRHLAAQRTADTLILAFSKLYPDAISAGTFVGFSSLAVECRHPRTRQVVIMSDDLGGGFGGNSDGDGLTAVDTYLSNVGILPAEICERQYPIRIDETVLLEDTAGAGAQRGGLGIRRIYHFLDTCDVVFYTEQTDARFAPWGLAGGKSGKPALLRLERADGTVMPITKNRMLVGKGDRLVTCTGGGGGYGDPKQRDREAVREDLREGKISAAAARDVYGLV
ncbi:MAG: hydantoinase B/oxoprolinase family protein [Proteobacteria bacterium]|nr:hydantoinase B/oxoprolinase family protein [Pseudomonadota bacterium]MBS0573745.1 hydantoinase B/oxoprolinase family protein [Pseudomonadota bacterium]